MPVVVCAQVVDNLNACRGNSSTVNAQQALLFISGARILGFPTVPHGLTSTPGFVSLSLTYPA